MTRKEIIYELYNLSFADDVPLRYKPIITEMINTIMDAPAIEAEPVSHGRWIPCSERLPEDDALMLVNYIDNRPDAGDIWIGWHEMENVWYIDGEEHSEEQGNEVVAWMPLPEPWRGK